MTMIPAPKRVIRLEPMAPMRPLAGLKEPLIQTTKDSFAFIAFISFVALVAAIASMVSFQPPV
jgi:hypothetical protein